MKEKRVIYLDENVHRIYYYECHANDLIASDDIVYKLYYDVEHNDAENKTLKHLRKTFG